MDCVQHQTTAGVFRRLGLVTPCRHLSRGDRIASLLHCISRLVALGGCAGMSALTESI
jgi:hypothetical protein